MRTLIQVNQFKTHLRNSDLEEKKINLIILDYTLISIFASVSKKWEKNFWSTKFNWVKQNYLIMNSAFNVIWFNCDLRYLNIWASEFIYSQESSESLAKKFCSWQSKLTKAGNNDLIKILACYST